MGTFLLGILVVVNVVLLVLLVAIFRRTTGSPQTTEITGLAEQTALLQQSLSQKFADATLDMATRLEGTKRDLREGVTDRLTQGFNEIRSSVEAQLSGGRREQTEYRVLFREVVHPAGQAAYRSFPGEPVQGKIDRFTAAEVQEVARNEHGATSPPVDAGKYA